MIKPMTLNFIYLLDTESSLPKSGNWLRQTGPPWRVRFGCARHFEFDPRSNMVTIAAASTILALRRNGHTKSATENWPSKQHIELRWYILSAPLPDPNRLRFRVRSLRRFCARFQSLNHQCDLGQARARGLFTVLDRTHFRIMTDNSLSCIFNTLPRLFITSSS